MSESTLVFYYCVRRFVLLLCAVLLFAGPAHAAPPLTLSAATWQADLAGHVDVLEDPGGSWSFDEVSAPERAAGFVPYAHSGAINFGYSASAWWLRVRVEAAPGAPADWLLEVAFPTLDDVRLFWRGGTAASGDRLEFAQRPLFHRHFVFPLHLKPGEPTVVYLRVMSAGTLTVPMQLWQPAALHAHDQIAYGAHALYFGMLLALGLYNLLIFARLREPVYLAYVAFVLAMATGQLALSGLGYQFVWPTALTWQAISLNSAFAVTGLFGAWFTRLFLQTPTLHPRLDRLLLAFSLAFAATAVAPLLLPYRPVALATSLLGFGFAVAAVACGIFSLRRGNPGARFFLLAWLVLLIGVALMGLRNAALIPTNFLTVNGIQIGSAIEMLLLSFALADRIHLLRQEKERASAEALRSERARGEALRESERTLEARVAERTHALEAANRRLQESEVRLTELAQRDALTGLANRNLLFDRLEQAIRRAQRGHSKFAVLLVDLDEFKLVNDTHGHAVGDQVLIEIATRLSAGVRARDTVARRGGDEIGVLLEDADHHEDFRALAGKLLVAVARPIDLAVGWVEPGGSVGVAVWPDDGTDASRLLLAADQAMYRAKRAGRGQIAQAGRG